MSAIQESGDAAEPIQVLFTLHNQMNLLDFAGPLEVLSTASHNVSDPGPSSIPSQWELADRQQNPKPSTSRPPPQSRKP